MTHTRTYVAAMAFLGLAFLGMTHYPSTAPQSPAVVVPR